MANNLTATSGIKARDKIGYAMGDVASCCSASQYILLLVQANFENSEMVCRRVVTGFAREHPRSPARIQSNVLPLEPLFELS